MRSHLKESNTGREGKGDREGEEARNAMAGSGDLQKD